MNLSDAMAELFYGGQSRLVRAFEDYDGEASFRREPWQRAGLGGGRVCTLEGGRVFERAGVNVSAVSGAQVPPSVGAQLPETAGKPFRATGISMVLHPLNPYAPSFHANFRFFETGDAWWFGGGLDLTPMYGFDDDAVHFHRTLRDWCDRHPGTADHEKWKSACDSYFTIEHRGEMRGIGGVFFDHLTATGPDGFAAHRALVADGLDTILAAYRPILDRRTELPYGEAERRWQLIRRGRYAEFNLVYDRGTMFGLQTKGNIEAILISMPPMASWAYDVRPEPRSPEADLSRFLQPRDWAGARAPQVKELSR
ncbi:oxygen-dependent coproporphyrinogen oxidase [Amycolatopsis sp. NPDC021455]|uniref:oxygen-dependent coproporphyrinogen oxidase n=1 Tax=Amycolatopsis sp. NPDC021455 TaxID=3154901 RepID=UPI0033DD7BBE